MEISHRTPSGKKGNIQDILKNAVTDGKRKIAVALANRKRGAMASLDRERLSEVFKQEILKPPAKSADDRTHRYYEAVLSAWCDLKLTESRNASPYVLSNVRTRYERYAERYDAHMGKLERKNVDQKLAASFKFNEYCKQNPNYETALRQVIGDMMSGKIPIPEHLKGYFTNIEIGDYTERMKQFDRGSGFIEQMVQAGETSARQGKNK